MSTIETVVSSTVPDGVTKPFNNVSPPNHDAAQSIQWGAWSQIGMAHGSSSVVAGAEAMGLGSINPGMGLAALQNALLSSSAHALVR